MIGTARAYADKRRRFGFATIRRYRTNDQHKALCREKYDGGIAMLVVGWAMLVVGRAMRVVMIVGCVARIVVMVRPALVANTKLHVASKRIGEMRVMVRVVDAVHQRDIGLARQHDRERHAQDGDRCSKCTEALQVQTDLGPQLEFLV